MARDSFIIYTEWGENISVLSDEQAGVLVKALFSLAKDEDIPQMDAVTDMCFRFLKAQIDRDSKRYEEKKSVRSEAGKKGAIARWQNGKNDKRILANGKNSLYVDVDVNEDVNEYVNDDDDKKEKRKKSIIDDAERKRLEERDRILEEDDYAARHEDDGKRYFEPVVKLGWKKPSGENLTSTGHEPLTEEQKAYWTKRAADFIASHKGGRWAWGVTEPHLTSIRWLTAHTTEELTGRRIRSCVRVLRELLPQGWCLKRVRK